MTRHSEAKISLLCASRMLIVFCAVAIQSTVTGCVATKSALGSDLEQPSVSAALEAALRIPLSSQYRVFGFGFSPGRQTLNSQDRTERLFSALEYFMYDDISDEDIITVAGVEPAEIEKVLKEAKDVTGKSLGFSGSYVGLIRKSNDRLYVYLCGLGDPDLDRGINELIASSIFNYLFNSDVSYSRGFCALPSREIIRLPSGVACELLVFSFGEMENSFLDLLEESLTRSNLGRSKVRVFFAGGYGREYLSKDISRCEFLGIVGNSMEERGLLPPRDLVEVASSLASEYRAFSEGMSDPGAYGFILWGGSDLMVFSFILDVETEEMYQEAQLESDCLGLIRAFVCVAPQILNDELAGR